MSGRRERSVSISSEFNLADLETPSVLTDRDKLQLLLDGELKEPDASQFKARIARSPELGRELDACSTQRRLLREELETRVEASIPEENVAYAKLHQALFGEEPVAEKPLARKLGSIAPKQDRAAPQPRGTGVTPIDLARTQVQHAKKRGWPRGRVMSAGLGLAVAAAILIALWPRDGSLEQAPVAKVTEPPNTAGEKRVEELQNSKRAYIAEGTERSAGTEVVEADFTSNAGTVFAMEGAEGEPLAVIWIYE